MQPNQNNAEQELRNKLWSIKKLSELEDYELISDLEKVIDQHTAYKITEAEKKARLQERNEVALDNYRGHTFSDSTDWKGKFEKFIDNNEKRIKQLITSEEE